jgi:hypothetical protein
MIFTDLIAQPINTLGRLIPRLAVPPQQPINYLICKSCYLNTTSSDKK